MAAVLIKNKKNFSIPQVEADRLEDNLYCKILAKMDYLGVVEWQKKDDFCIKHNDGSIIYFQKESRLKTPFSIVISIDKVNNKSRKIKLGDIFYLKGRSLSSLFRNTWELNLARSETIDLNKSFTDRPVPETLSTCKNLLLKQIYQFGNFRGLAGLLDLIDTTSISRHKSNHISKANPWCLYALGPVNLMIKSAQILDGEGFYQAWRKIIGLGPGITPSGDDLLIGFLAVHHAIYSPFWTQISEPGLKSVLINSLNGTTNLSSKLLFSALQGRFSELTFDFLETLFFRTPEVASSTKTLINFGHTSGTDLLTGVVLSLSSI